MNNLCGLNSKLMNPDKRLYSMSDINHFLGILGLFPLVSSPTSKLFFNFRKKNVLLAIQPVYVWRTELLDVPNYEKMRMDKEESLFPEIRMQIQVSFYNGDIGSEKFARLVSKLDYAINHRGKDISHIIKEDEESTK